MSDSDDEFEGPYRPDMQKVRHKMAHIPTLEQLLQEKDPNAYTEEQIAKAQEMVAYILECNPRDETSMQQAMKSLMKKFKTDCKKSLLLAGYKALALGKGDGQEPFVRHAFLEEYLVTKGPRSQSGVLVVTVFTSATPDGQKFSCKWNCYYCPNEPGQPRSYLLNEPGVRRANRLEFDAYRQFEDRVNALVAIGHPADKVELLVLGGTWESYPEGYRERFVRDLFYAANTIFDPQPRRPAMDLLQEQIANESATCKVIGLTLETRPDTINPEMIVKLRQYGCTRVQLGVQHTDESILIAVNRQAFREDTVQAIRLLKDSCFKVDIHLMPDLPGATPAIDKAMFCDVLDSPDLQADQWKIYPCQTTPFTVIKEWYEQGKYQPYGLDNLIDVLMFVMRRVHPWIRLNRIIRDIPVEYVLAGVEVANLRQLLENRMAAEGRKCQDIRSREVKGDKEVASKLRTAVLKQRQYEASGGLEIFLSYETPDEQTIFGFLRLRFPSGNAISPFPELKDAALIRELHVYGNLTTTSGEVRGQRAQHSGLGTRLLQHAEAIASANGCSRIAVISGVGVRGFYRRRGYQLVDVHRGAFLLKTITPFCLHPALAELDSGRLLADDRSTAIKWAVLAVLLALAVYACR